MFILRMKGSRHFEIFMTLYSQRFEINLSIILLSAKFHINKPLKIQKEQLDRLQETLQL